MSDVTEIALRRTPPRRRRRHALLLLVAGVFPAVLLPLAWFWWQQTLSTEAVGAGLIVAGIISCAWLASLFVLPKPSPITLSDAFLDVPFGRKRLRFALPELLVARREHGSLVLFSAPIPGAAPLGFQGGALIPRSCFVDDEGAAHTIVALRERLRRVYGEGFIARLDDNERRQLAFTNKRPLVVWTTIALCVVAFGVQVATGALDGVMALIGVGANASTLLQQGQVWRVVTANLLHGSLLHLAMNLAALGSTGALVERWLGRSGMIIVLFVSGATGQLASGVFALVRDVPHVSVGISGAVFGVLGVLLWSTLRFRSKPTGGLRVPPSVWLLLIACNGAVSLIPVVDVTAHVAGFVAGIAAAAFLAPRPEKLPPRLSHNVARAGAVVCIVVVVISVAMLLWWRASLGV